MCVSWDMDLENQHLELSCARALGGGHASRSEGTSKVQGAGLWDSGVALRLLDPAARGPREGPFNLVEQALMCLEIQSGQWSRTGLGPGFCSRLMPDLHLLSTL